MVDFGDHREDRGSPFHGAEDREQSVFRRDCPHPGVVQAHVPGSPQALGRACVERGIDGWVEVAHWFPFHSICTVSGSNSCVPPSGLSSVIVISASMTARFCCRSHPCPRRRDVAGGHQRRQHVGVRGVCDLRLDRRPARPESVAGLAAPRPGSGCPPRARWRGRRGARGSPAPVPRCAAGPVVSCSRQQVDRVRPGQSLDHDGLDQLVHRLGLAARCTCCARQTYTRLPWRVWPVATSLPHFQHSASPGSRYLRAVVVVVRRSGSEAAPRQPRASPRRPAAARSPARRPRRGRSAGRRSAGS